MTCGYCGSRRYIGEARCRTCGCRADDVLAGESTRPYTEGALATQTQPHPPVREPRANVQPIVARRAAAAAAGASPAATPPQAPVQRRLFDERMGPKVVPIAAERPRSKPAQSRPRRPALETTQGRLDFPAQPPVKKMLSTTVEAFIYCEDPVATTVHRAIAAALDWSLVLIGYGLFALVFHLLGGSFALHNNLNLIMFGGMLGVIGLAYGGLWVVAGRDSAGMRWAQLRVTTFDGNPPDPAAHPAFRRLLPQPVHGNRHAVVAGR